MNQNNRTEKRMPLQKECIAVSRFCFIEMKIVDKSKMGLGLKTDKELPFKIGCTIDTLISDMELPQAKLVWTKKDFNNITRLGLKFLSAE